MNLDQFTRIMPLADAAKWFEPLNAAMREFEINTPLREAAFLPNLAHESNQLHTLEENLNYSAKGLARTWPNRYANADGTPNRLALLIANSPQRIANNVYADRMGNGPEALGNGWKHRGLGPIQITGKDNQYSAALYFHIDPEHIGEWLVTPEGGSLSAARFFRDAGCNKYADKGDFDGVCDLINRGRKTEKVGDSVGYAERLKLYAIALEAFGLPK